MNDIKMANHWQSNHKNNWKQCYKQTIWMKTCKASDANKKLKSKQKLKSTPLVDVRFLHICACSNCFSVHASNLHPMLLAHHYLFYIDVCCICTIKQLFLYTSFMCVVLCPLCVVSVSAVVTMFLLLSPTCMPHQLICTYLHSSPTACPHYVFFFTILLSFI